MSVGNAKQDFLGPFKYSSHNLSSDNKAPGTNKLRNKSVDQFVSRTPGAEDLHLKEGSDAIDNGTVLDFDLDIDGGQCLYLPPGCQRPGCFSRPPARRFLTKDPHGQALSAHGYRTGRNSQRIG
ncbi:MAG: hypothetical protein GF398_01270 [Chitinivibrionales bacterium]|nr:hypothetical protein [Chitinivibrionales bacterium]